MQACLPHPEVMSLLGKNLFCLSWYESMLLTSRACCWFGLLRCTAPVLEAALQEGRVVDELGGRLLQGYSEGLFCPMLLGSRGLLGYREDSSTPTTSYVSSAQRPASQQVPFVAEGLRPNAGVVGQDKG